MREQPIDAADVVVADRARRHWPSRRLALGLSPMPRPGLVLLLAGMALGPHGLRVLSESSLGSLDPAVSVALAALGVLVGLGITMRLPRDGRLFGSVGLESAATIALVAAGLLIVGRPSFMREPISRLVALLAAMCAVPSSAAAETSDTPGASFATRIADFDDVLPIMLGVVAVVWTRPGTPIAVAWFTVRAAAIAVAIAFATWLLIAQTASESEQLVFAIGALLLLGGAAAHLSVSALGAGLLAGVFWNLAGGSARDHLARDMRYLQHPLVVLLLIVAGSRLYLPIDLVGLVIAYVVMRLAAKRIGGWLADRAAPPSLSGDPGFSLSSPGVVGIAIALNVLQAGAGSAASTTVFAVVVAGSLGAELVSLLIARRERAA